LRFKSNLIRLNEFFKHVLSRNTYLSKTETNTEPETETNTEPETGTNTATDELTILDVPDNTMPQ
jgi:hypothetical protein